MFFFTSLDCIANPNEVLKGKPAKLSLRDEDVLESFFRHLLTSSSAGFVLFGEKPVCLYNFENEESSLPGSDSHRHSTEIKEGLRVWGKYHDDKNQKNNIFHKTKNPKKISTFDNEFLIINRKAFLDVVNKNLLLFQYKLGIKVSPEKLLNKLLTPDDDIFTVFKGNQALLGIILGYGTVNSISYERGTNLIDALHKQEIFPPYQSKLPPTDEEELKESLAELYFPPGFGYHSAREEIEELSSSITNYKKSEDTNASILFSFSYHKDTDETNQLLAMYDDAYLKIDKALKSDHLVEKMLEKFDCTITSTTENTTFIDPKWIPRLSDMVARNIWLHFLEIHSDGDHNPYFEDFVSGMQKADSVSSGQENLAHPEIVEFLDFFRLQLASNSMKKNWIQSKLYFKKLASEPNIQCIEPQKLYYRQLRKGEGQFLPTNAEEISANYTIKDINQKILAGTFALTPTEPLEISKIIPGLTHGLTGMQKNEIREIYIHPHFAYGLEAKFGEGLPLVIQIELLNWKTGNKYDLPELIPFDLMYLSQNTIKSKSHLHQLKKQHSYASGYTIWEHYKKNGKVFNLKQILSAMRSFQKKEDFQISIDKNEQEVLISLDWQIYHDNF